MQTRCGRYGGGLVLVGILAVMLTGCKTQRAAVGAGSADGTAPQATAPAQPPTTTAQPPLAAPERPKQLPLTPPEPPATTAQSPLALPEPPTHSTVATGPLKDWQPRPHFVLRAPAGLHKVALTFDAGSTDRAVEPILNILAERHVRCTFFLTGQFCKKFPKSCRAIADAGMELGNHSYSHPKFSHLTAEAIKSQLDRAEEAIEEACGRGAKPLFRFPFGDSDRHSLLAVVADGYQPIHWSLDSLDAFGKPKTADFVVTRFLERLQSGDVTLMHVSCPTSAEALPRIFDYLDRMGVQVVPVSELLLAQKQTAARVEPSRFYGLRKLRKM
jgi:peptidoglycan/xylan/chitin deacetylase (PgdA/CDA1 family)